MSLVELMSSVSLVEREFFRVSHRQQQKPKGFLSPSWKINKKRSERPRPSVGWLTTTRLNWWIPSDGRPPINLSRMHYSKCANVAQVAKEEEEQQQEEEITTLFGKFSNEMLIPYLCCVWVSVWKGSSQQCRGKLTDERTNLVLFRPSITLRRSFRVVATSST